MITEGQLKAGRHTLYYTVEGPNDGLPVFVFHGGWGPSDCYNETFQGGQWRVVNLHQRGCGRSTPVGDVEENTSKDIVADVEALRVKLEIDCWVVVGGSIGAMLAFLYAVEHPNSVISLVLRGTWLLRTKDIDWCYRGGMGHFYPEEWKTFVKHVGCDQELLKGQDPVALYHKKLFHGTHEEAVAAGRAWIQWDFTCGSLVPDFTSDLLKPENARIAARIGVHLYMNQQGWYDDAYILDKARAGALRNVRVDVVVGRYDLLCPPRWSNETCEALRHGGADCTVNYVDASGHTGNEAGIKQAVDAALRNILDDHMNNKRS